MLTRATGQKMQMFKIQDGGRCEIMTVVLTHLFKLLSFFHYVETNLAAYVLALEVNVISNVLAYINHVTTFLSKI